MEKPISKIFTSPRMQILILLSFLLFLYFFNLNRWDLWDPDEPRYAQVAKEMVTQSRDWILMHLNGKLYVDKPPLFFWLIGLSSYLWGGFTSFSVRFIPALFGSLTVILTYFIGKTLFSSAVGFISGLILATSLEFAYLSTRANIDSTLTFFTTLSLLCFVLWIKIRMENPKQNNSLGGILLFGFYLGMGLATLTKGPVGFIIPLIVSLFFFIIQRDWNGIKGMRLFHGILLFFAIVLPWYVPAVFLGGEVFLKETLFKHTIQRYAEGWSHSRAFYYYFLNFPLDFIPWTLFIPGALVFHLSKRKKPMDKEFLFLIIWFVSIFLFFSFSKGKRGLYLLPLYPATSIIVGSFWHAYISNRSRNDNISLGISIPIYIIAFLFFFLLFLLYLIQSLTNSLSNPNFHLWSEVILKWLKILSQYLSYIPYNSYAPLIFGISFLSIILLIFHWLKQKVAVFFMIVLILGVGFFWTTRFIYPEIDPYKSARLLSQEILRIKEPKDKLAMYGGFSVGPYNYYTGIVPILDIKSKEELVYHFQSKERIFCLIQKHEFEVLSKHLEIPLNIITKRKVGGKEIVLVSNQ